MQDLSQSDVEIFRGLGIVTIVDLRNADEVQRVGRGRIQIEPARFVNAPVLAGANLDERRIESVLEDDYLAKRYMQYFQGGGLAFVRALEELTVADNYPLIFNCFFGKDRTGVLAALVLGCLGVSREQIIADYALTATRVIFILEKLSRDPVHKETIERTDPRLLAADEGTMALFLDQFERNYGGARSWAMRSGISFAQLELLREILLE
jgi:protein tyrosine/serine phosphatase